MPLQHKIRGVDNGGFGGNGDDRPGHDLMGAHGKLRTFEIEIDSDRLFALAMGDLIQVKHLTGHPGLMQLN
jgi:hypothetical protein